MSHHQQPLPSVWANKCFCFYLRNFKMSLSDGGRSRLKNEISNLDQQGGGSRYIGGSGNIPTPERWMAEYVCLDAGCWTLMSVKRFNLVVGPCRWDPVGGPAETAEGAGDEDFLSAGKTAEKEAPSASSAETQGLSHCLRVGIYKLWSEQEQCWNSIVILYHVIFTASV